MAKNMMRQKQGFTLIELISSISIFVIISTVMVVNFREGERLSNLNYSARTVVQEVKRMQASALSSKSVSGGISLPQGFGIRFNKDDNRNFYFLFADKNNNKIYDGVQELLVSGDIKFPSKVYTSALLPDNNYVDVLFLQSTGAVFIDGQEALSEVRITLSHEGLLDHTKTIVISRLSGLAKIE